MATHFPLTFSFLFACLIFSCCGQQFSGLPSPNSYPNLSNECRIALNKTIRCDFLLADNVYDQARLRSDQLTSLCTTNCLNDLKSAQTTISQQCVGSNDTVLWEDVRYPARVVVDKYLYSYKLSCRKDSATSKFCDAVFTSWLNVPGWTAAQNCSDCTLGTMETHLNSQFGFDNDTLKDFKYLTSSCSKTSYTYTSPGVYAITTTTSGNATTATAVVTPSCRARYTAGPVDTCKTIALSQRVSTLSLAVFNGISADCSNITAGSSLCLGPQCTPWEVKSNDTCENIVSRLGNNVTVANLMMWNPNINAICSNLFQYPNTVLCVSPPGELRNYAATTVYATTSSIVTTFSNSQPYTVSSARYNTSTYPTDAVQPAYASPTALPKAPNTPTDCDRYREYRNISAIIDQFNYNQVDVVDLQANNCSRVAGENEVTVAKIIEWNPSLNSSNCYLNPGYSYCVARSNFTLNNTMSSGCIPTNITTANATLNCPCVIRLFANDARYMTCNYIAKNYNITATQLRLWNPWIAGSNCDQGLFVGVTNSSDHTKNNTVCVRSPTTLLSNLTITTSSTSSSTRNSSSTISTTVSTISSTTSSRSSTVSSTSTSSTSSAAPSGTTVPGTVGSYTSMGCYSDSVGGRAFPNKYSDNAMTLDLCAQKAAAAAAQYWGVEYGRECWYSAKAPTSIGGTNGPLAQTKCNMACPGNANQWCGGSGALQMYKAT